MRNSSRHESRVSNWVRGDQAVVSASCIASPPCARAAATHRLGRVDVVDEDAAVCAAVEGDAERLESLLTSRVPKLRVKASGQRGQSNCSSAMALAAYTHLHRHESVIDDDFTSEEVCANGSLVGGREALVDVCKGLKRWAQCQRGIHPLRDVEDAHWFMSDVLPTLWAGREGRVQRLLEQYRCIMLTPSHQGSESSDSEGREALADVVRR